jgi:hypothetical protein
MDELREQIKSLGYSEAEITRFLEDPANAPRDVVVLFEAHMQSTSGTVGPDTPEFGALSAEAAPLAEASVQTQEIARKIASDQPLSEEELAIMEGGGSIADTILAAAQELAIGEEQFNFDWVYNALQLTPGSLDTDKALAELWEHLVAVGAAQEVEASEAEKALTVKEILARSPSNMAVQIAVLEWGQENKAYTPDQRIDGVSMTDISALLEKGMRLSRAVSVGRAANQFDLNPVELAEIWEAQDATHLGGSSMALERANAEGRGVDQFRTRQPLLNTAVEYKAGLDMYNQSKLMAAVHVSDQELAKKLYANPYSLDSGELQRVLEYVGGAEGKESDPQISWVANRLAGGYKATATVDTESVRNAVQTLADAWNLTGSEGVAAALSGQLVADAVSQAQASLPNPFGPVGSPVSVQDSIQDVAAHVRARLREVPEYEALFGNKAAGESEEEYAARFENRSQSVLGDDVVGAVRAGMRSGNVNTIYQQGLNTEVGDSSTRFQELIARNARIFREML